jgi:hypothetical protein
LVRGWQKDRDGGFTFRHPELVTSKATLQLRDGDAPGSSDEDFLSPARRPGPLTRTRQASLQRARLPGHQRKAWAAASQPSCLNAAALRPTGVSARIIARDAVDAAPLTTDMPTVS